MAELLQTENKHSNNYIIMATLVNDLFLNIIWYMNIEDNKTSVKVTNQPGGKSNWNLYWNEPEKNPKGKTSNSTHRSIQSWIIITKATSSSEKSAPKKKKKKGNWKKKKGKKRKKNSIKNYPPMTPKKAVKAVSPLETKRQTTARKTKFSRQSKSNRLPEENQAYNSVDHLINAHYAFLTLQAYREHIKANKCKASVIAPVSSNLLVLSHVPHKQLSLRIAHTQYRTAILLNHKQAHENNHHKIKI